MRTNRDDWRALGAWFRAFGAMAALLTVFNGALRAQVARIDPRFDALRNASAEWDRREGPRREVVDMVCLVPDLATFFEAVSEWDEKQYFPVLIDDVEYSFKFLRVPARREVVRFIPAGAARFPKRRRRGIAPPWRPSGSRGVVERSRAR